MKNKKIRIVFILILLLNLALIISGVFLQQNRYKEFREETIQDFKSKQFINYVSNGRTKDADEFMTMLDSSYVSGEGEVQIGIEQDSDGNYINDSAAFTRDYFSNSLITNTFNWDDFNKMMIKLLSFDISVIENKQIAEFILVVDKGAEDAEVWKTALEPLLLKFFDPAAVTAALAVAGPLLVEFLPYGIEGLGIEIFNFGEEFIFSEQQEDGTYKEVTYDFSGRVKAEDFSGVEGETLGMDNWGSKEVHKFFGTLSFYTDARNLGDLHQSMSISNAFSTKSNTYYLFDRFLSESLEKYEGTPYSWYAPKYNEEKTQWNFIKIKTNYVDSEGEALLYSLYDNLDYHEYFDKALEIDGITDYKIEYASELYGNGQYPSSEFDTTSETNTSIYTYGTEDEITFSDFIFLSQTYKPFLRSVNYDQLTYDITDLLIEGVKLTDLPNI